MKSKRRIKSPIHYESRDDETGLDYQESFDLAEEIILEILLRLPVKSILKFRCVSKAWLSLFSSHLFIQTHTKISTEKSKLDSYRVIFTTCYPPSHLMHCSVRSLLCDNPLTAALNIGNPMRHSPMYAWMVGSCNGLICISMDLKDLFLWNPCTKKSKKVASMIPEPEIYEYVAYGFGFDDADDDYKVVGIFSVIEEGRSKNIVMLYGLRTDSWKRVGILEGGIPVLKSIKFAGGKANWSVSCGMSPNFRWDIVCLDLESGEHGTLEQPDYEKDEVNRTLGVLGGCICVLGYDVEESHVDVWVLKEYGVRGSWRKVFHFSCVDLATRFVSLKPLHLLPNGEILLVCGRRFIVCNPKCDSFRVLEATKLNRFLGVDILVESLVSPDVS